MKTTDVMSEIEKYKRVPVEQAITPFDGARVLTNRWWIVVDECILFYQGFAPQCNCIKSIAEKIGRFHEHCEILHFEVIYYE